MNDQKPLPERMFEAGFLDLIPVIPPGASLAPTSKIPPQSCGKIPGRRMENGLWSGFNWRTWKASQQDVRTWVRWGANVGLRSDRFPGVDIDCADAGLAKIIEDAALSQLGPAPIRVGNPPKRLLPYRTNEPFGRMRLWMRKGDSNYLVEILGQGTQYLVHGIHPTTQRAYEWSHDPADLGALGLTEITREKADAFLKQMQEDAEMLGYHCEREGDGKPLADRKGDQAGFLAPSMDDLRTVVELLPNTNTLFPGRTDWLKVGYAIRAAAGEENEPDAFNIFASWSDKWEGNDRHPGNTPEYTRSEWRRIRGPFSVGWSWLAEMARPYGYNDADFPTEGSYHGHDNSHGHDTPAPTPAEDIPRAPWLSDQWLAQKVVESCQPILRYCPALEKALVWDNGRWRPDAAMLAEDTIKLELRKIAREYDGAGGTPKEQKDMKAEARQICSAGKVSAVWSLVKSDRAIAVNPESLDYDSWILNTPGGMVDLKTGKMRPPDPDQLCSRATSVAPDFGGPIPQWMRFLEEATNGDRNLQLYLQRLGGYSLTGSTREQQYTFIWGPGGNGKGIFLGVLQGILHDYWRAAPMDTFTASQNERHATELAMLAGARLVTASETKAGKRWDDAKLKQMTGGDPIAARFMRADFFTYTPQFKLIFIGNHMPVISDLDEAMRRRTHLVPFTVTPKKVDNELASKLKAEWPAILAWFIQGCLEWQKVGLFPPKIVKSTTEEYMADSDPIGQWLGEATTVASPDDRVPLLDLFDSWREWCNRRGEYHGKVQRLSQMLVARKYHKYHHPTNRRVEFGGIQLVNQAEPLGV